MKRFGSVFAALVLLAAAIGGAEIAQGSLSNGQVVHLSAEERHAKDVGAPEFAAAVKIGRNLGNTFDAPGVGLYVIINSHHDADEC